MPWSRERFAEPGPEQVLVLRYDDGVGQLPAGGDDRIHR
jgi:hypothetical protein